MGLDGAGRGASWETAQFSACELVDWFPCCSFCSLILSSPCACFHSSSTKKSFFSPPFNPPSIKLQSLKPKCVRHFPRTFHQSRGTLWKFNEINGWLRQAWLQSDSRSVGCAAQLDHLAERWCPGDTVGRRGVAPAGFIWIPHKLLY